MDFRSAVMSPSGGTTLQPSLFSAPSAPLSATALGSVPTPLFLYPGQVSPVKPPNFSLMSTPKAESHCSIGVPPIGMQPPHSALLPPSQGALPITSSPESASSFAAALKSLARSVSAQDLRNEALGVKTGDNGAVAFSPKRAHAGRCSSSSLPASATGIAGPPAVSAAPCATDPPPASPLCSSASDTRKSLLDGAVSGSGVGLTSSLATSGDKSGFQPYRPDPALYSGLYPLQSSHHSLYSARVEEQMYLERLALLRSPSALALGCSPFSAFSAGQFPSSSELHSLSPAIYLHSQSLYLQERMKLEEEARRRSTPAQDRDKSRPVTSSSSALSTPPADRASSSSSVPLLSATPAERACTPSRARRPADTSPATSAADELPSFPTAQNSSCQATRSSSVYRPYLLSPAREQSARAPLDLSPAGCRKPAPVSPRSPHKSYPPEQSETPTPLNLSSSQSSSTTAVDLSRRQATAVAGCRRERVRPGRKSPASRSAATHSPAELRDRSPLSTRTSHPPDSDWRKSERATVSPAAASLPPAEQQLRTPPAQLTASLNRTSDLPAKRVFLSSLGLVPDSPCPPAERRSRRPEAPCRPPEEPACPLDEPALNMPTAGSWRGVSEAISVYTHYNNERAAAAERARQRSNCLEQRHSELQRTGELLQLRMNEAVACRQQLNLHGERLQQQLTQLRRLLRQLQSPAS